jgi:GT2 family glycosyltransferase
MPELDAAVIVPQFGRFELTVACLSSFRAAHMDQPRFVVVDDGSAPGDIDAVERCLSARDTLVRQEHRGVTAAWNAGWQATEAEFLVFLNNDSLTQGPWLNDLLTPLACGEALMTGVEWRIERELVRRAIAGRERPLLLAGWCIAMRRDTLAGLGGFDPELELYFSDTDFQLRLMREHGDFASLAVVPGLPLTHLAHATAHGLSDQHRQWLRDRRRFLRKWTLSQFEP